MRQIFDSLDAQRHGYIEVQALLDLWTKNDLDSLLPGRLKEDLSRRIGERLTFDEFTAAATMEAAAIPSTPDLSRARRQSFSRRVAISDQVRQANVPEMSPLIISTGLRMLNNETTTLKGKLSNAELEISYLKTQLKAAEASLLSSTAIADEQLQQADLNSKRMQVLTVEFTSYVVNLVGEREV